MADNGYYGNIKYLKNKYNTASNDSVKILRFHCEKCRQVNPSTRILETYLDENDNICQINHCWCRTSESVEEKFDYLLSTHALYKEFKQKEVLKKIIIEKLKNNNNIDIYSKKFQIELFIDYFKTNKEEIITNELKELLLHKYNVNILDINNGNSVIIDDGERSVFDSFIINVPNVGDFLQNDENEDENGDEDDDEDNDDDECSDDDEDCDDNCIS